MSKVVYKYFTVKPKHKVSGHPRQGFICMALECPPKDAAGEQTYKAAFSFCSPEDKFQKAIGKKIATGRLLSERKPVVVSFEAEVLSKEDWEKVSMKAIDLALKSKREGKKVRQNSATREVGFAPDWLQELMSHSDYEIRSGIQTH